MITENFAAEDSERPCVISKSHSRRRLFRAPAARHVTPPSGRRRRRGTLAQKGCYSTRERGGDRSCGRASVTRPSSSQVSGRGWKMGVYVFQCRGGCWVKVGHFKPRWGTARRGGERMWLGNPWFRVERRGFTNIKHPPELAGKLAAEDLDLVAWYPNLTTRCERRVHRSFSQGSVGEFHPAVDLGPILSLCDSLGCRVEVDDTERARALAWAGKHASSSADRTPPAPGCTSTVRPRVRRKCKQNASGTPRRVQDLTCEPAARSALRLRPPPRRNGL